MSYIRWGWPLKYVKGNSKDYVFSNGASITDYGNISDSGFIEMLFEYWETDDIMFKKHFIERLARRLNVKLRLVPLTENEILKGMENEVEYQRIKKECKQKRRSQ